MLLYLRKADEICQQINQFASAKILWLDTEIAAWDTPNPQLSLIQVLANPQDLSGNCAYLLDVFNQPDLVNKFVQQIMANPKIEKVFHNASFDLRYLDKRRSRNVTCTLKLARKIGKDNLGTSNLKLKTLATELCGFTNVDAEQQASDWGIRPLSQQQLQYAKMDTVYLAQVHLRLLELSKPKIKSNMSQTKQSENTSLNVTQVRVAFECPRLFYLQQHCGGKTLFLPPNRTKGVGTTFHKLADECIKLARQEPRFRELLKSSANNLQVEAVASQMQQLFFELVFLPHLSKENPERAATLNQIWQGLITLFKHWATLLIKNRHYVNSEQVITRTFIAEELPLEHYFTLPDKTEQRLTGKLDSLIFDFTKNRLCVVEYKTYQPVDASAQLGQVALYSYMLKAKKKVPVDSAVYSIFPEFKEAYYSWEELENTVHDLIPYKLQQMQSWLRWEKDAPNPPPQTTQLHLCEICPQQEKCQSYFSDEKVSVAEVPVEPQKQAKIVNKLPSKVERKENNLATQKPTQPKVDVDNLASSLVTILQSYNNIDVMLLGAVAAPAFIRVKLKPNLGVKIASLLRLTEDLQVQLATKEPPMIAPQAGYVSVDLPRSDRQVARFDDYIKVEQSAHNASVKIAIGIDLNGELVEANLSDPNTCHFLVGGTTGSGKSEFLRSILLSLIYRYTPEQLQIALVDPKRVTFPEFADMGWLYSPMVKDSDRAISLMEDLVSEMERRYQLFENSRCGSIDTYNAKSVNPLPRIVCIFDEYADFMIDKESRKVLEDSIKRLGAMARAAGIHLIIATQRPDANIVTPIIRSNLPGRVALRTASEADSAIILGGKQTAAKYLLGKGDLLYLGGAEMQRLQSLFAATITLPK
ncbi:MAG: FtsK/SpoIIIE domain-containing protein [Oscillatoria sp. PMC 1068.18]|nr:FtsK/SpoIIIE domain-containing protein [Oscillatoria sp. PMC 1076.18]MEC4989440.1 FtsK/SpoIIIE domain-containing protein [Oscillatoria sp. PMC 1068.18]